MSLNGVMGVVLRYYTNFAVLRANYAIFLLIFAWAVQQCSTNALPVMN